MMMMRNDDEWCQKAGVEERASGSNVTGQFNSAVGSRIQTPLADRVAAT